MKLNSVNFLPQANNSVNIPTDKVLDDISVGDILGVEVIELSKNKIVIKLEDGRILNAKSKNPIDINIGDFLKIIIKNKTSSQVYVQILEENINIESQVTNIKEHLINLNYLPDEKNLDLVQAMINNEIPVTKESLQNAFNLLNEYEDLTTDKLIFLIANKLPISEESITILNNHISKNNLLGNKLDLLLEKLTFLEDTLSTIINTISNKTDKKDISSEKFDTINNNGKSNPLEVYEDMDDQEIQQQMLIEDKEKPLDTNFIASNKIDIDKSNYRQEDNNRFDTLLNNIVENIFKSDLHNIEDQTLPIQELIKLIYSKINSKLDNNFDKPTNNLIQDKYILDISNLLENNIKTIKESIDKIFNKINVNKPDELAEEINPTKLIAKLISELESIEHKLNDISIIDKKQFVDLVTNIKEDMLFMSQINKSFYLLQIPLNINNYNTSADLYILKNSHNKNKFNPSNLSVFLSIETSRLGTIQTLINIKQKDINCKFYLENKKVTSLIKSNLILLNTTLDAYGYRLNEVTYKENIQDINILNISDIITKSNNKKIYSIDMKV